MIDRRKLLQLSALAIGGSVAGFGLDLLSRRASATTPSLQIGLQNTMASGTLFAVVTGYTLDTNALILVESDGQSIYHPATPSSAGAPLAVDCAIAVGGPGSTATITIPQMGGGRIWFSVGQPLKFLLNPGPNGAELVEPSVTNPSDPNYNLSWDFCEFTYNSSNLYANITYVDFVSIPIALQLTNATGAVQSVTGLPSNGLETICANLNGQNAVDGAGWDKLVITTAKGANLRALSPYNGIVLNPSLFYGYYQPYVDQVWSMYSTQSLVVNTGQWGNVAGSIVGDTLTYPGVATFAQPAAADIFSCSTGPFGNSSEDPETGVLIAVISAAFNRSTLLIDSSQPDGENPATYYTNPITNHYARIVHAANLDGHGYAFGYDDVAPTVATNQSGYVTDPNPVLLTIAVGGGTATTSPGSGTVSAYSTIPAASYIANNGTRTEASSDTGGGVDITSISNGCWLAYEGVDFGSARATQFIARVASGAPAGVSGLVEVALDSPTATPLGSFAIASTGGWQDWRTVPANITTVTGTHTVYLVFSSGQPADFVNLHWFTFA
jgi:hypothetical protein